jgi:HK97 family phage prohead protease
MDLKTLPISGVKAGPDDGLEEGEAWVYASTWTRTPDAYGDVVAKGAFTDTIREWKDSGNELPILFGHNMSDPDYFIGGGKEMLEDDHGFLVKIAFDLTPGSKAEKVYRLVKGRRITQLSFAYDVLEDGTVEVPKAGKPDTTQTARELRKLKLYEVSVVPIGANQDTEVLAVKAVTDGIKAGRVLSSKNLASLKSARDALDEVINAAGETDPDKANASHTTDADEAQAGKSATARMRSAEALVAFIETL